MKPLSSEQERILDPATIRARTRAIYDLAHRGGTHFELDLAKLDETVALVLEITKRNYPDGKIPVHGRYEHLRAGGVDRVARIRKKLSGLSPVNEAKALVDLVVLSVLLDAGAGATWKYSENGETYSRSEGLAVASAAMFDAGLFSDDPKQPMQATAAGLHGLSLAGLEKGFQISPSNPMAGLEGRLGLLNRLGDAMEAYPEFFRDARGGLRPGNLVDALVQTAGHDKRIEAKEILKLLLIGFSPMWPARAEVDGLALGDTWAYEGTLVPFHKLSQWLTYSLLEPVETAGLEVTGIEKLTGLPEYRNGGLFLDLGVLKPRDPALVSRPLSASDPAVIEWRALTVQLLDEVGRRTREKLGKSETELPLARVLQGGTWSAGRETAKRLRPDGSLPLNLQLDGTVF